LGFLNKRLFNILLEEVDMLKTLAAALVICVACAFGSAHAALIDNGGGLIYDTDLNVTWYATPNYDTHVQGDYVTWASGLTVGGVTGWRLPTTTSTTTGEMGHLYTEPGNPPGSFPDTLKGIPYYTSFWTGTSAGGPNYYVFDFDSGQQSQADVAYWYFWIHGLAVHDGNVGGSPVPLPSTVLLLGPGLLGLAGWRRFRKS
jgi:hypothetical protein